MLSEPECARWRRNEVQRLGSAEQRMQELNALDLEPILHFLNKQVAGAR